MILRFTKFSRPKLGFVIALVMLFAPAFIVSTVESAPQKNKTTPTPKKKQTPTPAKKTQSKTKPTPTPKNTKTNSKTASRNDSKSKKDAKRNEKPTTSKNDRRTADKNSKTSKNSKSANTKNSKQSLTSSSRIPSKNSRDDRNSRNNRNSRDDDRNRSRSSRNERTSDRNKPTPEKRKTADVRTNNRSTQRTKSGTLTSENNKPETRTTETTNTTELPQIIVTSFSVPVRSQANPNASTVSSVRLGTVLRVTEKNPAWYRVQYSANGVSSTGWISANAVNDLNASGKTELYRQIVERNYKPQMDFESAAEFYEFLSSVGGDLDSSDKSAEIELKRLLALRSALRTIPADKRETAPYSTFLKNREREIVYNEPSREWLVVSNEFWNLHTKYKKSAFADTIAWEAANNPLPGECQGYVNCYLFDMRMRFAEYLNLHPNGARAGEALKNMTVYLSPLVADAQQKTVYTGPTDVTDRAEFNNLVAELRTIVARLKFVEKETTLQQLRTIAEAYR